MKLPLLSQSKILSLLGISGMVCVFVFWINQGIFPVVVLFGLMGEMQPVGKLGGHPAVELQPLPLVHFPVEGVPEDEAEQVLVFRLEDLEDLVEVVCLGGFVLVFQVSVGKFVGQVELFHFAAVLLSRTFRISWCTCSFSLSSLRGSRVRNCSRLSAGRP